MPYYIRKSPNYVLGQKFTAVKMRLIKKSSGGGGSPVVVNDVYTKMLLHFNDDATAASFADAAQSPLTQTKFGTVATSTAQSKFGGKSLALNGTNTNKLQFANPKSGLQSTFNFGAQDFTMEGWFYITALTNEYQSLIEFYDPAIGSYAGPVLLINPSNRIAFHEDTNGYILATSITPTLNQWYHIAAVRKSNVITIYVNGDPAATSAFTATLRTSYAQCNIGNFPHVGGGYTSLNGYVDNVRVQLGEAVYYPAGFTPEASAFTDGKNLLLHFDGANNSTTMTDSSTYGKATTAYNGAVISTTRSKFGGSSAYFPGNAGNMIIANNSSDFAFGTGDFTVEYWMNITAMSSGYSGYYNCMFDTRSASNNGLFFFMSSSRQIRAYACGTFFMTSTGTVPMNEWVNIAFVRKNGVFYLYINGVLDTSVAAALNMTENKMNIGCNYEGASIGGIQFNGYIDEFRVTKGAALYNPSFTPPTSAVSANSYTKFLMNFDGTNGSTNFIESSSNLTVNVQGNATISTEQSKFGGSSLKMTGGNGSNGLKINNRTISTQPIYLGDSDWTMEGWFWFNQSGIGYQPLISFGEVGGSTSYPGPQIYIESNSTLTFLYGGNSYPLNTSHVPAANQWHHIAASKSNTSVRLFINGTQVGSTLSVPKTFSTPEYVYLGIFSHARNITHFNGYIDGVRIQVGESLYNSNFTPATSAPTANANTKLLMNFENVDKLNDANNSLNPTIVGGGISVSTDRSKFGSKSLKMTGGTTDYVRAYNNSQPVAFIDDPFTIEGWFWLNANNAGYQPLIMLASTGDFQGPLISTESNNTLTAYFSNGSSWAYPITTSFIPSANAWHHVALTREAVGGPIKLYCDGDLKGTNNTTAAVFTSETMWIGHYPYYPGGARTLNGYVDDVRIVVGKATYPIQPSVWSPPVTQLTSDTNTKLLLNFNTNINDSTTNPSTVTAYGGAVLSSAQSKFGGSSMKFTRSTGSRLTASNVGGKLQFGSSDFCIETWLYLNSMPGGSDYPSGYWIVGYGADNSADGFDYWIGTTNIICAPVNYNTQVISVAHGMTTGQWYHVALTRKGASLNLFINGTLKATSTITGAVYTIPSTGANANLIGIGSGEPSSATSGNFDGYMDDFRITVGDSVYGGVDFTPPTTPFTLIG